MGLTISYLSSRAHDPKVRLDQRLYLSKDGETLLPEGHEDAAFLFCVPGRPFLASMLEGKTIHKDCGKVTEEDVDPEAEAAAAREAEAEATAADEERAAKDQAEATANATKSNAETPAGKAAAESAEKRADEKPAASAEPATTEPPEFPKAALNDKGKKRSGYWELSDGSVFKGNKAAATDAEAELEPPAAAAAEDGNSDANNAGGE